MDRDKVIKALEVCSHDLMGYYCEECPYEPGTDRTCREILMTDALELLKEQEAVEPKVSEAYRLLSGRMSRRRAWCGACGIRIRFDSKFCEHCGRAVKWDA